MKLRLAFFALVLPVLALGGCAGLGGLGKIGSAISLGAGFEVTKDQVNIAKAGYTAGPLPWFSGYRDLYDVNPCRAGAHATLTNVCAEFDVLDKLQQTHVIIDRAIKDAEAGVAACAVNKAAPACTGLSAAYSLATKTIGEFKGIAKVYGYGG